MPSEDTFEQIDKTINPLLACVKNILDFYFGEIDTKTISAFYMKSNDTFNVSSALEIFKNFNLTAFNKKISADLIPIHFLPSILIDNAGKSLVYLKKTKDKAIVFDPIKQQKHELDFKALKAYKNALLIFKDSKHLQSFEDTNPKAWFYGPLKTHWKTYVEIGILTLFINIFALAIPLFVMNIYNRVIPNQAFETLFVLASGTVIVLFFDIVLKHSRNHILEQMTKKIGLFWEEELMRKMMLAETQHDHFLTGSKSNLFKELQQIRDFFTNRSLMQIIDFPFFIIAMLVIYLISPVVAIVPFLFSIVIIAFNFLMQQPISKLSKNNSQNLQSKYSFIFESIQGTESIKLNNATPTRMFLWRNIVAFTDGIGMKMQSLHIFSMNLSQLILQLVTIIVICIGVFEIVSQNLSVGGLIAITMLSSRAMVPIVSLSGILIRLKEMGESIDRINEYMSLPTEDKVTTEAGIGKIDGKIEFKNVTYRFRDSQYASIDNISFTINPGEKVGIIGKTGAGKSTLLKLLVGLISPTKGSIYLDNHDITTIHPVEIRQNIGVMPQEPFLFSGTLKENIELFRPISKKKMMELLEFTGLEEFIKKSGKGSGLQMGERGCNLSVGQRHLVSLARAIANEPSMLILDEPTTGLDMGLEKTLIDHLKTKIGSTETLIVITHRLAALELVDRIIVMNDGKIIADGPKHKILSALKNPMRAMS